MFQTLLDGRLLCIKAIRKVVGQEDLPAYLEGIVEDITERKQEEEALIKSEEDLQREARNLLEVNTTLKVLLENGTLLKRKNVL